MPEGPGRIEMLLNAAPSAPPADAGPQIFVNGQPVAQQAAAHGGPPGDFALDVAPNGSSTVGPLPQPKAQPTTPPGSHQPEPPKGSTAPPPHTGAPKHSGTAPPGHREGVPPVQPQPHSGTPHPPAHGAHQGGQQIVGHGKHAARVDLTDKMHPPLHYVTHKNPDGSLDVTFPKGHGNAHDIRVHVPAGKNLDMNVSRDAHGHIHVQSKPATPAAHKPTSTGTKPPVLAPPDGKAPKGSTTPPPNTDPVGSVPAPGSTAPGSTAPGSTAPGSTAPGSTAPGTDPGSSSPASPSIPTPAVPSAPGDSGPGGSAAPGPADPANPANPAQPPTNPANPAPPGDGHAVTVSKEALVSFTQAISSTADDVGKTQQEADINLGFPGPGVAGIPISMAHTGVRDAGIQQVASTHTGLNSWVTALQKVTANWGNAEQGTQDFANSIQIIAPPSI